MKICASIVGLLSFLSISMGETILMPEEGGKHALTWMAYGATVSAWGKSGSFGANRLIARKDLMRIAANIARFEPVMMMVSDEKDKSEAQKFLEQVITEPVSVNTDSYEEGSIFTGGKQLPAIQTSNIKFIVQSIDDLWIRDTGAVFVTNPRYPKDNDTLSLYGINFNFNGWGQVNTGAEGWKKDPNKAANGIQDQPIKNDQKVADFTIMQANATKISTWLVIEGGGVEVDGKGTAVCTESCIINPNRNPGKTKADVESELNRILGVNKVIWLPGVKAKDITDGHVDFYARFSGTEHIIYALDNDPDSPDHKSTLNNEQILKDATDALGNKLTPVSLNTPDFSLVQSAVTARNGWDRNSKNFNSETFAASYVGFYAGEKYLLMAQYGDPDSDLAAFNTLKTLFPNKLIMQITTDGISNGGGTIHCATQQQIFSPATGLRPVDKEEVDNKNSGTRCRRMTLISALLILVILV